MGRVQFACYPSLTKLTFQEAFRVLFVLLVKKTDVALSRISRETTDLFHGPRYSVIAGQFT